jgi:hypothetical protein
MISAGFAGKDTRLSVSHEFHEVHVVRRRAALSACPAVLRRGRTGGLLVLSGKDGLTPAVPHPGVG